jgi:hypothetical protein
MAYRGEKKYSYWILVRQHKTKHMEGPNKDDIKVDPTVKQKQSCYRPELTQRVERGIALPSHDLGARKG